MERKAYIYACALYLRISVRHMRHH
jgi:hypothetical protein